MMPRSPAMACFSHAAQSATSSTFGHVVEQHAGGLTGLGVLCRPASRNWRHDRGTIVEEGNPRGI